MVITLAILALAALVPLRRPGLVANLSFLISCLWNEIPFVGLLLLLVALAPALSGGAIGPPGGAPGLALAGLVAFGFVLIAWRGLQAGPAMGAALRGQRGDKRDGTRGAGPRGSGFGLLPPAPALLRAVLAPLPLWRHDVKRLANIQYGPAGRYNRLDVYRPRHGAHGAPVLIHFHGGHFEMGWKSFDGRPLFQHLASRGWICVSANYRLRKAGRFPAAFVDAKRVIAWVRGHAAEIGADPSTLVVSGSSAGAHMASMAALTPNDPVFQPGFEKADTTVSAVVGLYGYYGPRERGSTPPSGPEDYIRPDAPPFLLIHGTNDTVAPIEWAETFTEKLAEGSEGRVLLARLPGAQHGFDLTYSLRFGHVIHGIERFVTWVRDAGDRGVDRHPPGGRAPRINV